jgi:hypothetical protein
VKPIDIHERLEVRGSSNNLVDGSMDTCEMFAVGEEVVVRHNRHNMLVNMAELVVRIAKDNPQDVFH